MSFSHSEFPSSYHGTDVDVDLFHIRSMLPLMLKLTMTLILMSMVTLTFPRSELYSTGSAMERHRWRVARPQGGVNMFNMAVA